MNDVQLGYSRDKQIVERVERCRALDANQIGALFFGNIKTGKRKAQERLQKLADGKQLKRTRYAINEPYVYFQNKLSGRLEHLLALNWVYVWLNATLPSWESLRKWEYEQDYEVLQADGFAAVLNTVQKRYRFMFVEIDCSDNAWDKVAKYNQLYRSGRYGGRWWVEHTERFPTILCVTTSEARLKTIRESIAKENTHNLKFDVRLLDDLKREAVPWGLRSCR